MMRHTTIPNACLSGYIHTMFAVGYRLLTLFLVLCFYFTSYHFPHFFHFFIFLSTEGEGGGGGGGDA
jgi:hypothetical protein